LELPPRVEKEHLVEVASWSARYELSSLTNDVAVFTQGMLSMDKTLFGIIQVDPRNLLEDGIRKELVRNITNSMNSILVFPSGRIEAFEGVLEELAKVLLGYKRSFEYISDYVTVYGLKIWQEEFSRIINFFVEQECAVYLHQEIYFWQSQYWNDNIPIPLLNGAPVKVCFSLFFFRFSLFFLLFFFHVRVKQIPPRTLLVVSLWLY
jgi:WASH complex subunit strumpellin